MKQISTVYITSDNKVLLANFRPYGPYGGLGGFIDEHGSNAIETAYNTIRSLTGLTADCDQLEKKGEVLYKDLDTGEEDLIHIFTLEVASPHIQIKKSSELHKLKWVSKEKVFNYKLFPNLDRLYMAEILNNAYFEVELTYSKGLVSKK